MMQHNRKVVAFYSNPKVPRELGAISSPMNALTREMRFIIHELNHFYYHIEPATTPLVFFFHKLTKSSQVGQ